MDKSVQTIDEMCKTLRLSFIRGSYETICADAERSGWKPLKFLQELLLGEVEQRTNNGVVRRIREARFPVKKYLVDFDRTKYAAEFVRKFDELETLQFITNKENIILIGTPGAGKTHYATALGIAACLRGKSVLFVSAPDLVIELKEKFSNRQFTAFRHKFERYDLVILDELGYVSFDKDGSELLFNLLSARHTKGSVVVTTNLTFDRWTDVFGDATLTGAMVDRLAHKAHVLDISREKGGRLEETLSWLRAAADSPSAGIDSRFDG
jgi:DNA replication protein DnaC